MKITEDQFRFEWFSGTGKEIPEHVIASMIASWEEPTLEEGFKEIWFAN
jgi:hypothetical protein